MVIDDNDKRFMVVGEFYRPNQFADRAILITLDFCVNLLNTRYKASNYRVGYYKWVEGEMCMVCDRILTKKEAERILKLSKI